VLESLYSSRLVTEALNTFASPLTPLFLFDLITIRKNMQELAAVGQKYRTHFVMAVKSFPSQKVAEIAAEELSGFEYSNGQELQIIRELKTDNLTYFLNRPYFRTDDILTPGSDAQSESIVVLDHGFDIGEIDSVPEGVKFLIRIQSENHKSFGQTRYGFDPEHSEIPALIRHLKQRFAGFHFHYGSEANTPDDFKEQTSKIIRLCRKYELNIEMLDLGGGIHRIDKSNMEGLLAWLAEQLPKTTRFFFEPGRALSENAGALIGTVLHRQQIGKTLNIVSTISPACHLRWADPILFGKQTEDDGDLNYKLNVLAPTCHEADRRRPIAICKSMADSLTKGAPIRFRNISGYSWALNTGFNGVPKASLRFTECT
jgi:diaminopimelate decarboxylase